MDCSDIWSCISQQLPAPVTLWYQSMAPYLAVLVALFLSLYTIWYFTTTTSTSLRAREAKFWVFLVFLAATLLLLPAVVFHWQPSLLLSLLGIPSGLTVFDVGPEILNSLALMVSASTLASWAGLSILLGVVVWPVARLGQPETKAVANPKSDPTPTPQKEIAGAQLGEITPIRTTSTLASTDDEITRPVGGVAEPSITPLLAGAAGYRSADPEKTSPPMAGAGQAKAETLPAYAWLEFRWMGTQPYQGPRPWVLLPGHPTTVGRKAKNTHHLIDLPDADSSVSREQLVIAPSDQGYVLSNKGSASVRVDNHLLSQNQSQDLRNGAQISIGSSSGLNYVFVFHLLPKPILQVMEDGRDAKPVRIDKYMYTIGGPASGISLGLQRPAAVIYVDNRFNQQPGFVVRAELDAEVPIMVGDQQVQQDPVRLKNNDYIDIGEYCKLLFQLPA